MSMGIRSGLAWAALGLVSATWTASGQVIQEERDTKVTGPRGRTIERDIKVQRGPGYIDRQVEIKRPGGTLIRDTRIQTLPGGGRPFGPPYYAGPRYYGGPRFVENVIVQRPPVVSAFVGVPALSFFFGGAPAPPPSPVVVAGPPMVPQPPPAFDAFTDAIGRLKSFHAHSRRDGALALGRIGDPRAVPALNERLEHDFDKDVRVAAAWALGEIGDEGGAVALERAVIAEKHHHEVRDAASLALKKIPKPGQVVSPSTGAIPAMSPAPSAAPTVIRSRPEEVDPGPTQATPSDTPPPPPVPEPPARDPS